MFLKEPQLITNNLYICIDFPVAHACFFSIELPAYSSFDILKNKLRYAMFNFQEVVGDEANAAMSFSSIDLEE